MKLLGAIKLPTIVKRIVYLFVTLLTLHALLFSLFRFLPSSLGGLFGWGSLDNGFREAMTNELGLDGTWLDQYGRHLRSVLTFNFGHTLRGRFSVTTILGEGIIRSLPLFTAAAIGALLGPLTAAAWQISRGVVGSQKRTAFNASLINLPPFVIASLAYAIYYLFSRGTDAVYQMMWLWVSAFVSSAVFPFIVTFAMGLRTAEILTSSVFFRSLRAMGLTPVELSGVLIPMLFSSIRPSIARVMMGGVLSTAFIELLFGIPGYGRLGIQALQDSDFALMFGWVFSAAGIVLIFVEVERWPSRSE